MVEKRVIKFNSIKISDYDRHNDEFDVKIFVNVNEIPRKIKKHYKNSRAELLRDNIIEEIKEEFGNMNFLQDSDDILDKVLIVMIDDFEKVEDQLLLFFKKVKDKIRDFKNNKRAEDYLNIYNSVSDMELKF